MEDKLQPINKDITHEEVAAKNKALQDASKVIFGDSAEMRIVDPKKISILHQNARYFKKEQFKQLVENLRQDKRLSSTPLCHVLENDRLEVLSGNHRVQASIQADISWILIIVLLGDLSKNDQIKIQLSHNALVGEDDDQILADLWNKIDEIKAKCYAGLSTDTIETLKKIKLVTFSTPQIRTKQISFAFSEAEAENVHDIMTELQKIPADKMYVSPMEQFDDFFNLLQQVKEKENIKNGSLAVLQVIELASIALEGLQQEKTS